MLRKILEYKKITMVFFVAAALWGMMNFFTIPRQEDPDITLLVARVVTTYPGANPEKVEKLVTKPLEEGFEAIKGVKKIESTSSESLSVIMIEVYPGTDTKKAWDDVRYKIDEVRQSLPDETSEPQLNTELIRTCMMVLHLEAPNMDYLELEAVSRTVKDELKGLPGVAEIQREGLPDREIQVVLDMERMARFNLTWSQVADAIKARNITIPGGKLKEQPYGLAIQTTGEYLDPQVIAGTILKVTPEGNSVYLRDIAAVSLCTADPAVLVRSNGTPGVSLVLFPKENIDRVKTAANIRAYIKHNIGPALPAGVTPHIIFDQAVNTRAQFNHLYQELFIGMGIVFLVCLLALPPFGALLVAVAIPLSVLLGMGPLGMMDLKLHQISVAALVIVLGILVDDSIVTNDNIQRHLELGDTPMQAATLGIREVAYSITNATVATIAAFAPLFLLEGNIGEFIFAIPQVVTVTLLASLVVSLFLTPIVRLYLASRPTRPARGIVSVFFQRKGGLAEGTYLRLLAFYRRSIDLALSRPWRTVAMAVLFMGVSLSLFPFTGKTLFPSAERNEFLIDITTPTTATLEETLNKVMEVEAVLAEQPEIKVIASYTGKSFPQFYYNETKYVSGSNKAGIYVSTRTDRGMRKPAQLVELLRSRLREEIPGANILVRNLEQGIPVGAPVAVRIKGEDLETLRALAGDISARLRDIPGAINVDDTMGPDIFQYKVQVDEERANRLGVTNLAVASTVLLMTDGMAVSTYQLPDEQINVVLKAAKNQPIPLEQLKSLPVPSSVNGAGIPLNQLAEITPTWAVSQINRNQLVRTVTVSSYTQGRLPSEVVKELQNSLRSYPLPQGYEIEYGGEQEESNKSFTDLAHLSLMVMVIIYLLLAVQFNSLLKPLIIMVTVFLGVCGALAGIFLTGNPIGFMAALGVFSLAGVVVRNGIVLIEFVELAVKEGKPLREALAQAGQARLRPILLTMLSAVGGLAPMAIAGSSLWQPMAIAISSGLIISTALTLYVIPTLYLLLENWKH
ncbi:efflux RND transporter permease subunit [Pelotomaculum terephthalicicum JT]|uniref:efflux RND transporter permease subunit n=1 Tax=Pelotomaculum TaxID=191373 RepID=UPI0009D53F2B|nr:MULTISPECIES: efflux RND transporter permease subunit [Pelotomaculum]MCG9968787.1 efflux RND transporter permease subunit [Pelotomaculum terephthalicicum JT]OPX89653.1 MAG: Swarming motility protein SwrC [Pelotomaculum sp. PtaB.Bin117]